MPDYTLVGAPYSKERIEFLKRIGKWRVRKDGKPRYRSRKLLEKSEIKVHHSKTGRPYVMVRRKGGGAKRKYLRKWYNE